jgi:hypothetical protein
MAKMRTDGSNIQAGVIRARFPACSAYFDDSLNHALIVSLDKFTLADIDRTGNSGSRF